MASRGDLLREVMTETGTTQTLLSEISGVRQPSISGFLSGRVVLSDEMLDRLLSCMGYRLEVVRRPFRPTLTRSVERSWRLHRELSTQLSTEALEGWRPKIVSNLDRLSRGVHGQPHTRNLDRWRRLIDEGDITGIRRIMTGLDTDSIEMREVSPLGGLAPESERRRLLAGAG